MRIVIIGAGAVGGYYGARLVRAGQDVHFVARGKTLAALRENGLELQSIDGDDQTGPLTASDTAPDTQADLLLITVKAYDTGSILDLIAPAVGPDTVILSLQNGLENEDILMARFGPERVVGAICYIGAEMVRPGVVHHVADGQVVFGEWDGRRSERCQRIEAALREARINASISENIRVRLWGKLLWNTAFNTTCALARCDVGAVMDNPATRALVEAIMGEVVAAARAEGVALGPDSVSGSLAHTDKLLRSVRPSMLQDALKGRRLEHQAFCGAIERVGLRHGFPTPVCSTLNALLDALDTKGER